MSPSNKVRFMATDAEATTDQRFCEPPGSPKSETSVTNVGQYHVSSGTRDSFTGECGPHCRPTCITLMLDIDDLLENYSPLCQDYGDLCSHHRNIPCNSTGRHSSCSLEDISCLGPVVFDDKISLLNDEHQTLFERHERCTSLPDLGGQWDRFRSWPTVTPSSFPKSDPRRFFEFCNIVEEQCGSCSNNNCSNCQKIQEPFPDGWTNFVVSASIPHNEPSPTCVYNSMDLPLTSGILCWAMRISIYYPKECPVCHPCPPLGLGDRFGPLEIVAIGSGARQPCFACDSPTTRWTNDELDYSALDQCHETVDCESGKSLGLPAFLANNYSFTIGIGNVTAVGKETVSTIPEGSPDYMEGKQPNADLESDTEPEFFEAGGVDNDDWEFFNPEIGEWNDAPASAPHNKLWSSVVVTSPIGCAMVIIAAMAFYCRLRCGCKQRGRQGEEILYVESADGRAIDNILGRTEEEDEEVPTDIEIKEDSGNVTTLTPTSAPHQLKIEKKRERKYCTTSLLEELDKNEVEVLYMEGTHHTS